MKKGYSLLILMVVVAAMLLVFAYAADDEITIGVFEP